MNEGRCDQCGGRSDRPGRHGCDEGHPARDVAQEIVAAIEGDLDDRRGLHIGTLDDDLQDQIRDTWAAKIRAILIRAILTGGNNH